MTIGPRRRRILALLAGDTDAGTATRRLCEICAQVVGTTGAGLMLMAGRDPQGSVCSTDAVSERLERLQFALGEGPCIDAHAQGTPIIEPDLADPVAPRWVAFGGPALEAGARAVFGFPLRVGAARLGALNLYSDRPGALTDDQHADALVMADVAAEAILLLQAEAPIGILAAEIEAGGDFQDTVHQATGMVAAQLGVPVAEALVRLRAHAFGSGRPLDDVALEVVARSLRFGRPDESDPGR